MTIRIEFVRSAIVPPPRHSGGREIGACVDFLGIVREMENNESVPGLFYEAYEPMARLVLERIRHGLQAKYPCEETLLIHRLGFVPVGEASIFLRAQSSHRQQALGMITTLMDRLKRDVPIWKSVK